MIQHETTDSNKQLVKIGIAFMEKNGVKSPDYKYYYSPDGGKTNYGYNNKRDLPKFKNKYPPKN